MNFTVLNRAARLAWTNVAVHAPKLQQTVGPVADMLISPEGKGIFRKEEGDKKRMFYSHIVFITSCVTESMILRKLYFPPLFSPQVSDMYVSVYVYVCVYVYVSLYI